MLIVLDYLLAIFHISLTLFNLTGWIFPKTRKLHVITISLTLGAWLFLGIWYGLGYCPLTDWHWNIKRQLGEQNLTGSCIKYYADALFRTSFDRVLVDQLTGAVMLFIVVATLVVNLRKRNK